MNKQPDFDVQAAHSYFSAHCFNSAWDLIDKSDRSPEEDERMIQLNQASLWHWSQRVDCSDQSLSVGYWQAARIHALLGQVGEARRYGQLSLQYSGQLEPFYRGYAYEALARAEQVAGNKEKEQEFAAEARRLAEMVSDAEEKKLLVDDLAGFG
jgi:hypothetical protein